MQQCSRCQGFVPPGVQQCPNCAASRPWWVAPLAFAGAGLASVTLSACYGPACATKLPDGGLSYRGYQCFDCTAALADGGDPTKDSAWRSNCLLDDGTGQPDGGASDAGGSSLDGGRDGG